MSQDNRRKPPIIPYYDTRHMKVLRFMSVHVDFVSNNLLYPLNHNRCDKVTVLTGTDRGSSSRSLFPFYPTPSRP